MALPKPIQEAIELINNYRTEVSNRFTTSSYTCICCKEKEIKLLHAEFVHPLKQEEACWNNGAVQKFYFGYGSTLDCESFYVGICDDCMRGLIKENLVKALNDIRQSLQKFDEESKLF